MFTIMGHGGMEPQDRDLDLADSDCDCDSVTGINMKLSSIHLGEPRDQRLIKMYMSVGRQKGSGKEEESLPGEQKLRALHKFQINQWALRMLSLSPLKLHLSC